MFPQTDPGALAQLDAGTLSSLKVTVPSAPGILCLPLPPCPISASRSDNGFGAEKRWQSCCRPRLNLIYFNIVCIRRTAITRTSKATALAIGRAMLDKKALDVQVLHVAPLTTVADYLVLGSAESDRQTRAIADHIDGMLSRGGERPLSIEGTTSGQWVLLDFGDVVAHLFFRQDTRVHYALERLWSDAKTVEIPDELPHPRRHLPSASSSGKPGRENRCRSC